MGIKLDWQIEADHNVQRAGEDPEARARRRMQRIRLMLFSLGILIGVLALVGGIAWRLNTVDETLKRTLIDTVKAETATLRGGDFTQFIAIQRSASSAWLQQQSQLFKRYQDLKTKSDVRLTGNVIDTAIDGQRGRAVVEEIIDGVPYHVIWYYWRYVDGWRHAPSDYQFWGDAAELNGKNTTIRYHELDSALAHGISSRVESWWVQGCATLACPGTNLPKLTVDIIAYDTNTPVRWDSQNPNNLIIASPLVGVDRFRSDVALPETLDNAIAEAIAEREFAIATNQPAPEATADAAWLRQNIVEWLAATFTGRSDPDKISFIQSLQSHYGNSGVIALLHSLTPAADIGVVGVALKQPVESLALDWRTFFQWRLDVEKTLLARNDRAGFEALWDASNPAALAAARQRETHPTQATPQVQAVTIAPGPDGIPRATVQASSENTSVVLSFRLVNGSWRRVA